MSITLLDRENLLQTLSSVQAGLSQKEITEQSDSFIFTDGKVITFNDELSCSAECDIGFEGAVRAAPLLAMLSKFEEENIEIEESDGELILRGKRQKSGITIENEILLPVDKIEAPGEWNELSPDFIEALHLAQQCVVVNDARFFATCVHIHPEWIESCDGTQLLRYHIKTGIKKSVMIRGISAKHIAPLGMSEISKGKNWLHFRNQSGVTLSCRLFLEDFPDIEHIITAGKKGVLMRFPKGIKEASDKAEVFASESMTQNLIKITLRSGCIIVKGEGPSGWYTKKIRTKFTPEDGPITFLISPKLIDHITKEYDECKIAPKFLAVETAKFIYVTCVGTPEK